MNELLQRAYMATRRRLESKGYDSRAARAITMARADIERGQTSFYFERGLASYQNTPFDRGGRWIEAPELAGLRFVGFADEIAGRAISHRGWYLDSDGDGETARGAVYQLPAKGRRPRYVEAIRVGNESRSRDWIDQSRDGAAIVFLRERHLGDAGGFEFDAENDSGARDAAYGADEEARLYAESEVGYNLAWRAGADYRTSLEEAAGARAAFLALRRDMKVESRPAPSTICAALVSRLEGLAAEYGEAKRKARELWNDRPRNPYQADLASAWRDGAEIEESQYERL